MKKYIVVCAGLCLAFALTSCGSKESAYKKAYEKAKSQEAAQVVQNNTPAAAAEAPVVTPVQTVPSNKPVQVDNSDNVSVRQERVSLVNGSGLNNFSVVVGSFGLQANAEGLQKRLKAAGYDAQIVKNEERTPVMYRVVASTFADKADAVRSRDQFRSQFPDAWLLYNLK